MTAPCDQHLLFTIITVTLYSAQASPFQIVQRSRAKGTRGQMLDSALSLNHARSSRCLSSFAVAREGLRGKRNEKLQPSKGDGFSAGGTGARKKRSQKMQKAKADELSKQGYTRITNVKEFETKGKDVVPVILGVNAYAAFRHEDNYFLTDAACPPYKFPLADAKISTDSRGRVTVEEPLTGSIFDLATGEPISWCPESGFNPIKGAFQLLKKNDNPEKLPTYALKVTEEGEIWGKLPGII